MATASNDVGSSCNTNKNYPKDALVIATILKEMGVQDYEPRVVSQLLELIYRKYEYRTNKFSSIYLVMHDGIPFRE